MKPWERKSDLRDPLKLAASDARLVAVLLLVTGTAVFAHGVFLVRLVQFQAGFMLIGLTAFYLPGVLIGAAAFGMTRGWGWSIWAGSAGCVLVIGVLSFVTIGQLFAPPVSVVPLAVGVLWTFTACLLLVRIWRALPYVSADPAMRRGFGVEEAVPTADDAEATDAEVAVSVPAAADAVAPANPPDVRRA